MRKFLVAIAVSLGLLALIIASNAVRVTADTERGNRIALADDCDPRDVQGWLPQGCANNVGTVTRAQFNALLDSPLADAVVGHPAWRISPAYSVQQAGSTLLVANTGGRGHTFTHVANFGGGFVPPLNEGLTVAPECAAAGQDQAANVIPPGGQTQTAPLTAGDHKFQCCIHTWMRAVVHVQ
jgi:plastocyanin